MSTTETTLPRLKPKPKPITPLGRWIRRTGISGAELGRAIGADKGTISRIVNGGSCSAEMAARIKRATGLKKLTEDY